MRGLTARGVIRGWMLPLIGLFVANLVVFASWSWPQWRARGVLVRDELVAARGILEPRLERARSTYGEVAAAEKAVAELRGLVVAGTTVAELLATVQEAAERNNLTLREAGYQTLLIEELDLVQLGMMIPVEGPYGGVRSFLDDLTRAPEFLLLQGVGLSSVVGGSESLPGERLRVDLAISAFLVAPTAGVEAANGAPPDAQRTDAQLPDAQRTDTQRTDPERTDALGTDAEPTAGDAPRTGAPTGTAQTADLGDYVSPSAVAERLSQRLSRLPPLPVELEALRVRLDELEHPDEPAPSARRNLFAFVEPTPMLAAAEQPPPEPGAGAPALEPTFPLRLVGVMKLEERWHASLTDGFDIWVGAAGTVLPNGFEILEVGVDYVEVSGDGRQVRLTLEDVAR